jgi:DNA-binding transcriptional regulator YiaG
MSAGYTSTAEQDHQRYIFAHEMDAHFRMPPGWFHHSRTRAILKTKGFPLAVLRGRYLRSAVEEWERRQSLPGLAANQALNRPPTRKHHRFGRPA